MGPCYRYSRGILALFLLVYSASHGMAQGCYESGSVERPSRTGTNVSESQAARVSYDDGETKEYNLIVAAYNGDDIQLSLLLKKGANPRARFERSGRIFRNKMRGWPMFAPGWTALHAVAYNSGNAEQRVKIAQMLISKGALLDADDGTGRTPVALAIAANNEDLAVFLLDQGARVDVVVRKSIDGPLGATLVHLAIQNPRILRALKERGTNMSKCDARGLSPLEWARRCNLTEAISILSGQESVKEEARRVKESSGVRTK